ncbi:hypothetical protein [Brevundimonas sp.]|uniref:hypothetical protein n=1 Tax=Brevundimonas sp. TaxID=1871086 RepID=UPI00289B6445|nr:hypothetical protein [Brevundimonas sp.]
MPKLPVTVDYDFYAAMAAATSAEYADSYLSGAELYRGKLLPRTHIAWERLKDSTAAMGVIRKHGVTLREPPYFTADRMDQLQGRAA